MDESILISIKKLLGIPKDVDHFDPEILIHINTVFTVLAQLGVGTNDGFMIEDDGATWADYIGDRKDLQSIKTYIYLKVRMIFDPPTVSSVMQATDNMIKELEFRINATVDPGTKQEEEEVI